MDSVVAFVHAKGSSVRVPSKNLRLLGDVPLFVHAVRNALAAICVDRVVIDSDSDEILSIGLQHGATPLKRPADLASNIATGDDLMFWQASNYPDSDVVLQVIPTAPFLSPQSIDKAIRMLQDFDVDSVAGVFKEGLYLWEKGRPTYFDQDGRIPNSCDLQPVEFETTGLYVNRTKYVLRGKRRLNPDNCRPFYLSRIESVDINTPEDFSFAEVLYRGLKN